MRAPFRVSGLALAAGLLLAGGCAVAPAPTPVDRDFGLSHQLAIYGQTANPDAEENLEPVVGIDAKAALGALNSYRTGLGYSTDMDANSFDVRPVQPGVSEVRIKSFTGDKAAGAQPSVYVPAK